MRSELFNFSFQLLYVLSPSNIDLSLSLSTLINSLETYDPCAFVIGDANTTSTVMISILNLLLSNRLSQLKYTSDHI